MENGIPDGIKAYPICHPMPEKKTMEDSRRWTVCQLLREMWREETDPAVRLKLRIACNMTKTMADSLRKYEPDWGKSRWPYRA